MSTITLDEAKAKLLEAMKSWKQQDLHAAITDLMEEVPGRALEQWVAKLLTDKKDGSTPTIIGPG